MMHIVLMNVKIIHHLDLLNIINVQWVLHFAPSTAPKYSLGSCLHCSLLQRILIQIVLLDFLCDKFQVRGFYDLFEGEFLDSLIMEVYFFH